MPLGTDCAVTARGGIAVIVNDWGAEVCGGVSLSVTVTENVAETESWPLIRPDDGFNVSPAGKPDWDQV